MMDATATSRYSAVEKLLAETMGLDPESIGARDIRESTRAQMKELGINNIALLLELLRSNKAELEKLIERVVVPETWFFRDRESFAFLSRRLRRTDKPRTDTIRILSVPCSTGEEPYSIAITLLESGLTPERFRIDAADISRTAIDTAKRAVYGKGSFREKNVPLINGYFTESEGGLKLDQRARACVDFQHCNFVRPDALIDREPYDIIFCKNLLIYLNPQGRSNVAANLDRLLVPGGLLFTGHAEVVSVLQFGYTPVKHARSFACIKGKEEDDNVQVQDVVSVTDGRSSATGARTTAAAKASIPTPVDGSARGPARIRKQPRAADLGAIKSLADKGALDKALQLCKQFLKLHPRDKDAYYLMGLIKLASDAFTEAEDFFQKALYLDPQHYNALVHMGLLYEKKGDRAKASLIRERIKRIEGAGGNRQGTA